MIHFTNALCAELRPLGRPFAVIRTDPAPGFTVLVNDEILKQQRLMIEVDTTKSKISVAERAIQDREEILCNDPSSRSVTTLELTLAS